MIPIPTTKYKSLIYQLTSPPIITAPTYKLDVKAAKSSNISGLKISDIDSQEVEVTLKGEKGTINGASTSIFILENNFEVGDKITISNSSTPFTVQSGKTSIDDLLISLKDFLNQDTTFFTINKLTAVRLGSGEIAFVGNGAENITATKTAGSSNGAITKKTVNSTKDAFSLKYPDVIMTGLESASVSLKGSLVEINAILDELTFNAVENSGGSASVTASVKDSGGLTSLEQATLN